MHLLLNLRTDYLEQIINNHKYTGMVLDPIVMKTLAERTYDYLYL